MSGQTVEFAGLLPDPICQLNTPCPHGTEREVFTAAMVTAWLRVPLAIVACTSCTVVASVNVISVVARIGSVGDAITRAYCRFVVLVWRA